MSGSRRGDGRAMSDLDEAHARMLLESDFGVSRETLDRLQSYRDLLLHWNQRINLVGPATLDHFWARHALDSAQILMQARRGDRRWVDFGSGAGFPGLVIAALVGANGGHTVTLIEASVKRCAFLREAARTLGVEVEIISEKIEAVLPRTVDVVTARAFTSLDGLLSYAQSWMGPDSQALFLKGQDVSTELEQASTNWAFEHMVVPSVSDRRGCVLKIQNVQKRAV